MAKKILLSIVSGLVILIITWIYQNYEYSLSVEDGFFKKALKYKRMALPPAPSKKAAFVFINTGKDLALTEDSVEYGNVTISDRVKLQQFLQKLNQLPKQPLYTVLDLQFYYHNSSDPSVDSLLETTITKNKRLMIPVVKDVEGNYKDPIFLSTYAYSDYITFGSGFNKFRILNHSPMKSIPILLHEKVDNAVYKDYFFFATCNGKLCLSAIWPHYYLSEPEVRANTQTALSQFYNLGEVLMDMEGNPATYSTFFEDKVLIIGNFEGDTHSTPVGKMAGSVLLANIYLSLLNNHHIVSPYYLLILLVVMSFLSYLAWFSQVPKIKINFNFLFSSYLQKFLKSYISYFGCMFLLSLIALLVFDIQIALFLPSLILSGIEYIRQKKYLPEKKEETKS
jgi:CHASE2 domain